MFDKIWRGRILPNGNVHVRRKKCFAWKKIMAGGGGDLFKEVISSFHDISEKGHLVLKNNSFNNKFFKRSSRKIVKKKKRSHGILVFKNYFLRFIRVVFLI